MIINGNSSLVQVVSVGDRMSERLGGDEGEGGVGGNSLRGPLISPVQQNENSPPGA